MNISLRYNTLQDAINDFKLHFPIVISQIVDDKQSEGFLLSGLSSIGERWDITIENVVKSTGNKKIIDNIEIPEVISTGEVDIILFYGGNIPSTLTGNPIEKNQTFEQPLAFSSLEKAKGDAIQRVIIYADSITDKITSKYPKSEVDSWPTQSIEALNIKNKEKNHEIYDPVIEAPLLYKLSSSWNMSLLQMCDIVLQKASLYTEIVSKVIVIRSKSIEAISNTKSFEELNLILQQIKNEANIAAAQLGIT